MSKFDIALFSEDYISSLFLCKDYDTLIFIAEHCDLTVHQLSIFIKIVDVNCSALSSTKFYGVYIAIARQPNLTSENVSNLISILSRDCLSAGFIALAKNTNLTSDSLELFFNIPTSCLTNELLSLLALHPNLTSSQIDFFLDTARYRYGYNTSVIGLLVTNPNFDCTNFIKLTSTNVGSEVILKLARRPGLSNRLITNLLVLYGSSVEVVLALLDNQALSLEHTAHIACHTSDVIRKKLLDTNLYLSGTTLNLLLNDVNFDIKLKVVERISSISETTKLIITLLGSAGVVTETYYIAADSVTIFKAIDNARNKKTSVSFFTTDGSHVTIPCLYSSRVVSYSVESLKV